MIYKNTWCSKNSLFHQMSLSHISVEYKIFLAKKNPNPQLDKKNNTEVMFRIVLKYKVSLLVFLIFIWNTLMFTYSEEHGVHYNIEKREK